MNRKPARSDCCLLGGLRSASTFNDRYFGRQFSLMFLSLVEYLVVEIAECRSRCRILTQDGGFGRFRDMDGKPNKVAPPFADKRKRQAAWNKLCKDSGRSPEQSNRAASIIPSGASIKVLRWPSL